MAPFQLLSCDVALGGDILNVVARGAFNPVTYPEMLALKYIHGNEAVTNIFDVGYAERDEEDEFKRLCETYGLPLIREKLFPGAGTRLPRGDNRYQPRTVGTKANPGVDPGTVPVQPDPPLPDPPAADAQTPSTPPNYGAEGDGGYQPVADMPAPPPPDGINAPPLPADDTPAPLAVDAAPAKRGPIPV